jgi:hypothetical protein
MAIATRPDGTVTLPGLLRGFLERASVGFGSTCSGDLAPQIHWISGWRLDEDGSTLHCFIPDAFTPGLGDALRDNGRFAATFERIGPHETYQFKGNAGPPGPLGASDRAAVQACRARFVADVRALGPRFTDPALDLPGYILEPTVAVRLRVREVFLQTPGPGAGVRLVPPPEVRP